MTRTENATEIIIIQSPVESTFVERRLPISMDVVLKRLLTGQRITIANEHKNA